MNKPYSLIKILFYLILFLNSISKIDAQSKELANHIQEKLARIDERILARDYDLALTKLEELESYTEYISVNENRLILNYKRAQAYYGNGEQEKAMSLLLKGLDEAELLNASRLRTTYTNYLGEIFEDSKDYKRALEYFKKSLVSSLRNRDTISFLDSYLRIGRIFYYQQEIDSSVEYYEKIIAFKANENNEKTISKAYNNLSVIASNDDENFELAEEYGNKSLIIKQQQNDTVGQAIALIRLSNIQYKQNEFDKVKESYLKAYESVKSLKTEEAFNVKENVLYNLAYVNEELKDFESAYKYLEQATELKDSLAEANVAKNISEVEAKYNVAKEAQKTEEEKSRRQRTQYFFYGSILLFATLLVLAYIFYRNYRLKQENELDKVVNETQIKIINATIDAKENERKSIAETLHDSVSALLSSANLHLQATKAQLKTGYPQEITKAQTIVNEASVKIRDLSHELISSVLLKFGLAFAVHDMCQKYSNSEISLFSDDDGVKRYEQNFEIKIHNIIEELVNNILKHSKAKNASIILAHRDNNMLSIRMNDDGVGFDAKSAKMKGGLGLSHIDARIKVMKGVFNIVSSKDNGTSIFILVPIISREI